MPPGLRIRASIAMAPERCWSERPSPGAGVGTRTAVVAVAAWGKLPAQAPASAMRRVFVAPFARAARRAFSSAGGGFPGERGGALCVLGITGGSLGDAGGSLRGSDGGGGGGGASGSRGFLVSRRARGRPESRGFLRGGREGFGGGQNLLGLDDVGPAVSGGRSPLGRDDVGLVGRRAFRRDPRVETRNDGPMLENSCLVLRRDGGPCSRQSGGRGLGTVRSRGRRPCVLRGCQPLVPPTTPLVKIKVGTL